MKKFFLLPFLFLALLANAAIRTVSNNPNTLAQYSTIQAAVDASSSGDIIYVHGSPVDYSGFTVTNKRLTIIGPGWGPSGGFQFRAKITSKIDLEIGSSGTEIQGLYLYNSININNTEIIDLRIIRNYFYICSANINLGGSYSGFVFEGNVFVNGRILGNNSAVLQNFTIQNNVFVSTDSQIKNFSNPGNSNIFLIHNLFYSGSGSGQPISFENSSNLTLANNIFVRRDAGTGLSTSTFNNNLTFYPTGSTAPSAPWTINSNSNAGGNVHDQDPQMVDQVVVNSGSSPDASHNFSIAAGPANNNGSDGKDMGLLFNLPPDPRPDLNWSISRFSRLPYIFSMILSNPVVPAGGSLNVAVEARKTN